MTDPCEGCRSADVREGMLDEVKTVVMERSAVVAERRLHVDGQASESTSDG